MWIFTVNGFFTFVIDRKDPDYVWLRARLREDLERNFPGVKVDEHPGADYLFRARISRAELAEHMVRLIAEADVTSHFKDEMIRRAVKPVHGNRSQMMYALWNAGAAMQPYAPYSKTPRAKASPTYWKGSPADRKPGQGQTSLQPYTYGGTGAGRRGSEFDWDARSWQGGDAAPDPGRAVSPEASDDELDAWWNSLTDDERDRFLDDAETAQRQREEIEEDLGAAVRWAEFSDGPQVAEVYPAPRNRTGSSRRQRRKAKRQNRHNQYQQLGFSDSQARQEARNRQAYLDRKHGGRA
jgi:hypothetical protein